MSEVVQIAAGEIRPGAEDVLRALGRPPGAVPDERLARLLAEAAAVFEGLARPAGLWHEVTREAFAEIYRGDGENASATPLEQIYPRAERLALFAATVGEAVTVRIGELFQAGEYPLGAVLDATASEGAERAADVVQERWAVVLAGGSGGATGRGPRLLRYSPGYCGWNVSGQRALFRALLPEQIGISLNASCLMTPLKSVSGVIIGGPAEIHSFANDYPFCLRCREWTCRERLRRLMP